MQTSVEAIGIIPARYASSRFPGKPLALIAGKPMFQHVYERATACADLQGVYLATDDDRICAAAEAVDIPVIMTQPVHPSGSDRILEAARTLSLKPESVVVNIQGDEPALDPGLISKLLCPFSDADVCVTTPVYPLDPVHADNPDRVKVVIGANGNALYFSRSRIPFDRDGNQAGLLWGHIGLYAYRLDTLERFVALLPGQLEQAEQLEQLRLLENHIPIRTIKTTYISMGVDRPEDIPLVERLILQKAS
ncbi:MAG: 3-deoxy-manno-octulosonate cytidylyltransferase [Deltaproteobacteria bacterium]|nr:MAG: 3-deoxy-manno-octulosonate cytidylyltransferase [Deltaproteobacteria bacterium]